MCVYWVKSGLWRLESKRIELVERLWVGNRSYTKSNRVAPPVFSWGNAHCKIETHSPLHGARQVEMNPSSETGRVLEALRRNDPAALDRLVPLVYEELHQLAVQKMGRERREHTLQATALINEAILRVRSKTDFSNRAHYVATVALAMRSILIDYAKARSREKRGGPCAWRVEMKDEAIAVPSRRFDADEILALDRALSALAKVDSRQEQIVNFHYFGGLNVEEVAELLEVSSATVKRELRAARAWLHGTLSGVWQ